MIPWPLYGLLLVELLLVGWIDLKTKKISNLWALINVTLSVVIYVFLSGNYPFSFEIFLFPLGFIVIGFILYLMNIMGAGDSKFLATFFLLVPLELQMVFFEKLIISTLVTGVMFLIFRIVTQGRTLQAYFISRHWSGLKEVVRSRFSYAPVVGLAWILLGLTLWK